MPDDAAEIAYCPECGTAMDVSALAPFTEVECPLCCTKSVVKREFGPYTLLRKHAIGGMSVVFIAHDNTLDREVALKILNEDFSADERRISAFEEEARITAAISHPHVVRVLTTGRAFGRFYIAMELVAGGHLEQQIRDRGALPEDEVLPLALHIAEGLLAAHQAGLIHRDIKPGNILLDAAGNAKIVDFGLALVTKGGSARAEEFWATPYYVPPETVEGRHEDFRSDIYAFGATLYQALAGRPPCQEESMVTTVLLEAKKRVPPLGSVAPWLHAETCAVVDRMLAYEPAKRFQSYRDLIAAFDSILHQRVGEGVTPETTAMRRRRLAKKRERLWMTGVGVLCAGALGGVVYFLTRPEKSPEPRAADTVASVVEVPVAEKGSDPAAASRIAARYRTARSALESGDLTKAREEFAALRDDPEVKEPTATWAGVEAVIAGLLEGHGDDARKEAERSLAHLNEFSEVDPVLKDALSPALEHVGNLSAADPGNLSPGKASVAGMMGWMLTGLKEWEQGRWDLAGKFFEAVVATKPGEGSDWAKLYQRIARNYLDDKALLDPLVLKGLPVDAASTRKHREALDQAVNTLKTKGRARYNVRVWQFELVRHERELKETEAKPKPPVVPAWAEVRPEIEKLCGEYRFAEAAERLKETGKPEDAPERAAWRALIESAATLFPALAADLKKGAVEVPLTLKEGGGAFVKASGGANGYLSVTDATGTAKEIAWRELSPGSVIDLHRQLVKSAGEEEKLRRHEAAIAFDWLAGDRDRAKSAGDRLAQENETFKRRWEEISAGLK
ncbi:MAG TPA: serine/threonine-protein kinase [Luteolibacter sp.]